MKKWQKILAIFTAAVLMLTIWVLWGNTALEINEYKVRSEHLPEAFSGFRITHISDFHNTEIGQDNDRVIAMLAKTQPDIIVITGDLIDSRNTNVERSLSMVLRALEIAPVYYVSGNHESRLAEYYDLKAGMQDAHVVVLEDEKIQITRGEDHITIMGIDDPSFRRSFSNIAPTVGEAIAGLQEESDGYTVVLCHRPELFDTYVNAGVDLVFTGHAHGGQVRIPLIGGVVAPNQGFFPEYDAGKFTQGRTTMMVSRGVGNSLAPLRVNNRPELIVVELESGT